MGYEERDCRFCMIKRLHTRCQSQRAFPLRRTRPHQRAPCNKPALLLSRIILRASGWQYGVTQVRDELAVRGPQRAIPCLFWFSPTPDARRLGASRAVTELVRREINNTSSRRRERWV